MSALRSVWTTEVSALRSVWTTEVSALRSVWTTEVSALRSVWTTWPSHVHYVVNVTVLKFKGTGIFFSSIF